MTNLYQQCKKVAPGHKFRFKNRLVSLDATNISLALSLFPWSNYNNTKGAIKIHFGLDHAGYLPSFVCIGDGRSQEKQWAKNLSLEPNSINVFDRGFTSLGWFKKLEDQKVFFVTRIQRKVNLRWLKNILSRIELVLKATNQSALQVTMLKKYVQVFGDEFSTVILKPKSSMNS